MRQTFPEQPLGNCDHCDSLRLRDAAVERHRQTLAKTEKIQEPIAQGATIASPSRLVPARACTTSQRMLGAFFRAVAALAEPPMRRVVVLSLGLAVLTFAVLWLGVAEILYHTSFFDWR